jgi:hypothetical protein
MEGDIFILAGITNTLNPLLDGKPLISDHHTRPFDAACTCKDARGNYSDVRNTETELSNQHNNTGTLVAP